MAAAGWKGVVRFGPMIQFEVTAKAVDRETKFAFNLHHAECGGRLRANPEGSLCEACGGMVTKEQTVRGYKGVPGLDDEYLKSLEQSKSDVLEVDGVVDGDVIEPRLFKRSYDLVPGTAAAKPYALFAKALAYRHEVAIGKVVFGGKEQIVALRPRKGVLEMELLWWPDEVKSSAEAEGEIAGIEISEKEAGLAGSMLEMMRIEWDPSKYVNEYAATVNEYLTGFLAGKEPVRIQPVARPETPAMSLEDALAATLAALGEKKPEKLKGKVA
jgi:DNA end-binding protein Ku